MATTTTKPFLGAIHAARLTAALAAAAVLGVSTAAEARPTYFDTLKSFYGIADGTNLDACGVCHFLWTGTGARNPYGSAVEQQLYLGKSITQSLTDAEPFDSDGDGFTNGDEIVNYMTLPGYSCDNFHLAVGAPQGYDTYIEPLVASCLEPLDIRTSPSSQISFLTEAGDVESVPVTVFNNGSTDLLTISSYGLLAGAHPDISVTGPAAPFDIAVGQSVVLDVVFAPGGAAVGAATLRIDSNDPDESPYDIAINALGFVRNLAPAADRAVCLAGVEKSLRKYTKVHVREWGRCYLAEVGGMACDSGARDVKVLKAAEKLRASVGGTKDKRCAGAGLTPSQMGFPDACGGACGHVEIDSIADYAECLICRQDAATALYLDAALGTSPPDLPPNQAATSAALSCQGKLLAGARKAVSLIQKALSVCETANVTAMSPQDCSVAAQAVITKARAKADAAVTKCADTSGLAGCSFEPPADPACLGAASESIAADLVDAVFDQAD